MKKKLKNSTELMTMSSDRLESSKSTEATTERAARKWLITAVVTTATTTSSNGKLATNSTRQDRVDNKIASIRKVSHLESVLATK